MNSEPSLDIHTLRRREWREQFHHPGRLALMVCLVFSAERLGVWASARAISVSVGQGRAVSMGFILMNPTIWSAALLSLWMINRDRARIESMELLTADLTSKELMRLKAWPWAVTVAVILLLGKGLEYIQDAWAGVRLQPLVPLPWSVQLRILFVATMPESFVSGLAMPFFLCAAWLLAPGRRSSLSAVVVPTMGCVLLFHLSYILGFHLFVFLHSRHHVPRFSDAFVIYWEITFALLTTPLAILAARFAGPRFRDQYTVDR